MRGTLARKLRKTVYGPKCNGKAERENRLYTLATQANGNQTLLSYSLRREYQDFKKLLAHS